MTTLKIAPILCTLAFFAPAFGATSIIFSVPGALNTSAAAINTNGDVAGCYVIGTENCHVFLRTSDGAITTFDVPGANGTFVSSINDQQVGAGIWLDQNSVTHGFVRSASGVITTFDPPGAFTTATAFISNNGSIGGAYLASQSGPTVGYIRATDGSFTTFNAPNGLTLQGVNAVNATGDVAGSASGDVLYVRHSDGSFNVKTFDPLRLITRKSSFDHVFGMNASDQVVGTNTTTVFIPPNSVDINVPFVWASGVVTQFDESQGTTVATGINDAGEIIGLQLSVRTNTYSGFVRATDGTITTFQVGSVSTQPIAINNSGVICGSTITATSNPNYEGFLLMP